VTHGIAHALGAIFHIPHGRANALVLAPVIEFNADVTREANKHSNDSAKKYQKLARIVGLPSATPKVGVSNLIAEINRLLKYMDRPTCITECGISLEEFEKHREEIVKRALADACTVANPRKVEAKDINRILDKIAK
jgi:alcohol dehydrogenase class IV